MKLQKLESLRGLTALLVLVSHLSLSFPDVESQLLDVLYSCGTGFVMIFFVLSGFVIQYSYEKSQNKKFFPYFFKRFVRIYVPLIIIFILNTLLFIYEGEFDDAFSLKELIGNIFMLQDLDTHGNAICSPYLGNGPLWFLSYEWWYYMAFFALSKIKRINISPIVYIVAILATISYLFHPNWISRVLSFGAIWWFGCDLAKMYMNNKHFEMKKLLMPIGTIFICACLYKISIMCFVREIYFFTGVPMFEYNALKLTMIFVVMAVIWYKLKWVLFDQTIGIFTPLARISYCIYISHFFLVTRAKYLSFIDNRIVEYTLYILICFFISYVIEVLIYPQVNGYLRKIIKIK